MPQPDAYRSAAEALIRLSQSLVEARGVQFEPSPREVRPREDVTGTKEISNPTLDIAIDARRLLVSIEVYACERMLEAVTRATNDRIRRLDEALAAWNNEKEKADDEA